MEMTSVIGNYLFEKLITSFKTIFLFIIMEPVMATLPILPIKQHLWACAIEKI